MSVWNAIICDAAFSLNNKKNHPHQHYHSKSTNNETMPSTIALDRVALKSILQQLTVTTTLTSPIHGTVEGDRNMTLTSASAPPLQLLSDANVTTIQCPSLSLHQTDMDATTKHPPSKDRTQAKDHAIKLLARPMTFVHPPPHCITNSTDVETESLHSPTASIFSLVGRRIQQNVFASFALLVDCRLHAYTDVLTRHAIVLSSMYHHHDSNVTPVIAVNNATKDDDDDNVEEQEDDVVKSKMMALNEKKRMIQKKGAHTEAHALTSHFELLYHKHTETVQHAENLDAANHATTAMTSTTVRSAPLRYTVTMELHIPNDCETGGPKKIVPISFAANGFIKCAFTKDNNLVLQSVKIHLNTKELLETMVRETTRAVSIIVEIANRWCHQHNENHKPLLPRSVSYLAMPPPPPIWNRAPEAPHNGGAITTTRQTHYRRSILDGTSTTIADTSGLDLLCSAVVNNDGDVPVVSPQLSNTPSPNHHHFMTVDLTLDEDEQRRTNNDTADDVSRLSLDQCADIVDVCLFGDSLHTNHYDLDSMASISPSPSKRIKIEQ